MKPGVFRKISRKVSMVIAINVALKRTLKIPYSIATEAQKHRKNSVLLCFSGNQFKQNFKMIRFIVFF